MEPERTSEALSTEIRKTANGDSVSGLKPGQTLLDQVLGLENRFTAQERVVRNRGSAGIDGMEVEELQPYLIKHYQEPRESIRGGWYKPKPVKRVEIPKPDGGTRSLGVPTVTDRMVQQAVVQVLQPIFEQTFSDSSCGFRPKRSAHQAIGRAKQYYEEGYTYVVDLDTYHHHHEQLSRCDWIPKHAQAVRRTGGKGHETRDVTRYLLNRRVPNGTHGGVRGWLLK